MLLLIHIVSATVSLAYSAFLLFKPSKPGLNLSLSLTAVTAASGTALIICEQDHILQSCLTGLLYIGISGLASISAWRKLARQKI